MKIKSNAKPILIAEDDIDDRLLIQEVLKENRLINELICVKDGEELMDYLLHRNGFNAENAPQPFIILLDLSMPKIDGRQALMEIRQNQKLSNIPVILLTSCQAEEEILKKSGLQANYYINKPVTFSNLISAIRNIGQYYVNIIEV